MVHLLVYADSFDIEGLISSQFGPGRKEHILQVIDYYERDYANLKTYSTQYSTVRSRDIVHKILVEACLTTSCTLLIKNEL